MIREILYNVPPLFHLDREQWDEYGQDIAAHCRVWSEFSAKAVQNEMTDYDCLNEEGTVQKTVYGKRITAVANFGDEPYSYEGTEIAPHSVLMEESGQIMVYTPSLEDGHR